MSASSLFVSRARGVVFKAFAVLTVALVAGGLTTMVSAGDSGAGRAASPPVDVVNVFELVPTYHGRPVTWADVDALKARGKGRIVWVYSTNSGDYVVVFDDEAQLRAWQCTPAGREAGKDCQDGTTATTR